MAAADRIAKRTSGPAENEDSDLEEDADVPPPSAAAPTGRAHIYCPLTPPTDVPRDNDWRDYYPDELPLREHQKDKEAAQFVRDPANSNAQLRALTRLTGIKTYSSLWELPSILWPWSFPLDNMHLFFLNIAPHMRDHWRGNFFPWERTAGAKKAKFKNSGEQYCIPPEIWRKMNEDIKHMVHPTAFGNAIRGVEEFRKANEWKTWSNVLSPILLKGRLPEPFYSEWVNLATAITLATDYSVTTRDITKIHNTMAQFVVHYHQEYYRFEKKRLSACKPVFHAILHVADCIEWMGPMWSYSQWVVERMFSLWVPKVKLRSSATRNLVLALLRDVLVGSLRFTTELTSKTPPTIPLDEGDERP